MGVTILICLLLSCSFIPLVLSTIDCDNYDASICQPDLTEYCFTDGQVVQGSCEANRLVCNESKVLDESFESCQPVEPFNCTGHISDGPCLPDLVEYCFTNGETVVGSCLAKEKYCTDNIQIDTSGSSCEPVSINCTNHDPNVVCRPDIIEFCLSDGSTVKGICEAEKKVCSGEDIKLDLSGLSCKTPDCATFNTTRECDSTDETKFCLSDETIITGACDVLEAICLNGKDLDDFDACSLAHRSWISSLLLILSYLLFIHFLS